jgi:uncharacterized membrane protein YeaQ/YmgE (transglycosylase-associated protein family)
MGGAAHIVDHGVRPVRAAHGNPVISIVEEGSAMGFAAWVVLGVVAGWIASSLPRDAEPTQVRRLLVGVLGAVFGGGLASLLGMGSAATFLSVGAWLLALGGAAALLVIHSLRVDRCRPRQFAASSAVVTSPAPARHVADCGH